MSMLDFIEGVIRGIEQGNSKAGAKVLKHYVDRIKNGEKPLEGAERFVINCLSQIVTEYEKGKLPNYDEIFCMGQQKEKKRGPKQIPLSTHIQREMRIGAMFDKLRETYTYDETITIMMKELDPKMSKETIEHYLAMWNREE